MKGLIKKVILLFGVLLTGISILYAGGIPFTAIASRNHVRVSQPFKLKFTIHNVPDTPTFQAPVFYGFEVLSSSRKSSTNIIKGKAYYTFYYEFELKANSNGRFTFQKATAQIDGNPIESNSVTIYVEKRYTEFKSNESRNTIQQYSDTTGLIPVKVQKQKGAQSPIIQTLKKGGNAMDLIKNNVFIKVEVDKSVVFVGQQLTATYKLYTRLSTASSVTKSPSFPHFSVYDMEISDLPKPHVEDFDGIPFNVFFIRKATLFPLDTGKFELGIAEVNNKVRLYSLDKEATDYNRSSVFNMINLLSKMDSGNDSLFRKDLEKNGISYHDYKYRTSSPVTTIYVQPLPKVGKPKDFSGVVGRFIIRASLDTTTLKNNRDATLRVSIIGTGDISSIPLPDIAWNGEFNSYELTGGDHINANSKPYLGYRTFDFEIMPKVKGKITIPPVKFSYFNPDTKKYETVETSSFVFGN